jgi:predicted phage-related endonuclease
MHSTVNKPLHGSEEWLRLRWRDADGKARLSASVAAAVHNEHEYTTSLDLATELLADDAPKPKEQNEAMRRGTRLEAPIRDWAAEMMGIELTEPVVMYTYKEGDLSLIATLDAVDNDGNVYEVKTIRRRWDGELPRYWYWQGVQQAICANVDTIKWIIFDSSLSIHIYDQFVSSDEKGIHMQAARHFLTAINEGMLPDNVQDDYEHVSQRFPDSVKSGVELDSEIAQYVANLHNIKKELEVLGKREDFVKAQICNALGENEIGLVDGAEVVTWKTSKRTSFDTKRFEQDHPALAEKYRKESKFRTFRLA